VFDKRNNEADGKSDPKRRDIKNSVVPMGLKKSSTGLEKSH